MQHSFTVASHSRETAHQRVTYGDAQCPINRLSLLPQYLPTAFLGSLSHASSSPTASWLHRYDYLRYALRHWSKPPHQRPYYTGTDGKLGGAWEQSYILSLSVVRILFCYFLNLENNVIGRQSQRN